MDRYIKTTALQKIIKLRKRIRFVNGGTSSSKTISILMWLIDYCQTHTNKVVSVVSESRPHLSKGASRDFLNIMKIHNYFEDSRWNKTDLIYTFPNQSIIEFFSADQPGKVRGPRRDILFLNEANNINYEIFTQLEVRTKDIIWIDSNPTSEYWIYTEVLTQRDVDTVTVTYRDNEALDQSIIDSIESRKNNKNWYQIYALGQLGVAEGRIYTDWRLINGIPVQARLIRYGLDFGYTNDPTAIVGLWKFNDWIIVDQIIYQKGLSNKQIADIFLGIPQALVRADSSEPKSIDEIRSYGVKIVGSAKGAGSVLAGIQYIQNKKIAVTKRSVDVIKEYRNYLWMTDSNGKIINEPSEVWNHSLDAIRYGLDDLRTTEIQKGGAVHMQPKQTIVPQWTASAVGAIKGPDFITGFKNALNQRKSTSGVEFNR